MCTHHDTVDLAFVRKGQDLIWRRSCAHYNLALDRGPSRTFREWLQVPLFRARSHMVIVAVARQIRGCHQQRIIGVEEDQSRVEFASLRQCKLKGHFIGRHF